MFCSSSRARRVRGALLVFSVAMVAAAVACSGGAGAPERTTSGGGANDANAQSDRDDAAPIERGGSPEAGPRLGSPGGGRTTSTACGGDRPAGNVAQLLASDGGDGPTVDGGACARDDECDAGVAGRCNVRVAPWEKSGPAACTYKACSTDEDCAGGSFPCGCDIGWARQNLCLSGSNCRLDADCPTGERCVFSDPPILRYGHILLAEGNEVSRGPNYDGDALGWFCTTPKDVCGLPIPVDAVCCIYNVRANRWQWGYTP